METVEIGGEADHDVVSLVVRRVLPIRLYAKKGPIFGTCGAVEIGEIPLQRVGFALEDPQPAQHADDVVQPPFHAYSVRVAGNPGFSRGPGGIWRRRSRAWSGGRG